MTTLPMGGVIPPGFTAEPKLNEEGLPLFWLPLPPLEVTDTITVTVKTTEVTDNPVMIPAKVPLMEGGTQRQYEVTRAVYDDAGNIAGQEGTGQFLLLWTSGEEQEKDADENPLYWTTVEEPVVRYEPQPPIEITIDDERYVEGLEPVLELVEIPPPPFDLEAHRQRMKVEIHRRYEAKLYAGFTSTALAPDIATVEFYSDDTADRRLKEMEMKLRLYPEENAVPWLTKMGWMTMNREQFYQALKDYGTHKEHLEYELTYDNAYIENADSREEIDDIVAGW